MADRSRSKSTKVRGTSTKAQFATGLADIVLETVRLWRKHHLGYDQTKYVVEQARRRLKLQPLGPRRRTVDRLDKSEVERLILHTYQSHNKYGLMIKTLFPLPPAHFFVFELSCARGTAAPAAGLKSALAPYWRVFRAAFTAGRMAHFGSLLRGVNLQCGGRANAGRRRRDRHVAAPTRRDALAAYSEG
jgi:integrase/recombinase XerD